MLEALLREKIISEALRFFVFIIKRMQFIAPDRYTRVMMDQEYTDKMKNSLKANATMTYTVNLKLLKFSKGAEVVSYRPRFKCSWASSGLYLKSFKWLGRGKSRADRMLGSF